MSYLTIDQGVIVRHSRRDGRNIETPLPTLAVRCSKCGWETRAIDDEKPLPACICGAPLHVVKKGKA